MLVLNAVRSLVSKLMAIQCGFSALPLTCRDFSRFSEDFVSIMDCFLWNPWNTCSCTFRNIHELLDCISLKVVWKSVLTLHFFLFVCCIVLVSIGWKDLQITFINKIIYYNSVVVWLDLKGEAISWAQLLSGLEEHLKHQILYNGPHVLHTRQTWKDSLII